MTRARTTADAARAHAATMSLYRTPGPADREYLPVDLRGRAALVRRHGREPYVGVWSTGQVACVSRDPRRGRGGPRSVRGAGRFAVGDSCHRGRRRGGVSEDVGVAGGGGSGVGGAPCQD